MDLAKLKHIADRRPFQAFEIELVSGTRIPVRHPEEIGFALDILAAVRLKDGNATMFGPGDVAAVHIRKNGRTRG